MSVLNVRDVVKASAKYLQDIQDLVGSKVVNLRLEETELSDDRKTWLITLSFEIPNALPSLSQSQSAEYQREYKLFRVNAETGEVEAMKIREFWNSGE